MADVKKTKKDYFVELKEVVVDSDAEDAMDLIDFLDTQIAQYDARSEKAKEKAAMKKEAGDDLRDLVAGVLTQEYQSIDDILAQVDYEDVTKGKVTARLTALTKAGVAVKGIAKDGKKKITVYKLA